MEKRICLESQIFEITIAHLANNGNHTKDNDSIELNDVKITFDLFKRCFFENSYDTFQVNCQYSTLEQLLLENKTIKKSNFRSFKNGAKFNLLDIMNYKHIKDKKTKACDVSNLSLLKDLSLYTSLVDFKIYNNSLSLDNIYAIFNQHVNKKSKKYFRFKIKTSYYSVDLDETLSIYFNFLVKIPKNINVFHQIIDEPDDDTFENITYSNYCKQVSSNTSNSISIEESTKLVEDIDDDASTDSNLTESSCGNNEDHDTFF